MKVTSDYDENADVLYLSFDDPEPAICYEQNIPVLVRYNPGTDRISGITILNLKEIRTGPQG
jgi:uncharacterized protein YuzE